MIDEDSRYFGSDTCGITDAIAIKHHINNLLFNLG